MRKGQEKLEEIWEEVQNIKKIIIEEMKKTNAVDKK